MLRDGVLVVPMEALELQADIVCVLSKSSGKRSNWHNTLLKLFKWPTAKHDVHECALGVSADVGNSVEIGVLNAVIISSSDIADVLHTAQDA